MSSHVSLLSTSKASPWGGNLAFGRKCGQCRDCSLRGPYSGTCPRVRLILPIAGHLRVRRYSPPRGLTLYRVVATVRRHVRSLSLSFIPRSLYHLSTASSAVPDIYQLFALSRITNYRFSDWLAVFGFDLGATADLQVSFPGDGR